MKRFPSIKKNEDFRRIYKQGRSAANELLVMYAVQTDAGNRIGISASKKVGNSIIRHRCTRIIRECFRNNLPETKEGYDIVVMVRADAAKEGYDSISHAYANLLNRLHIAK